MCIYHTSWHPGHALEWCWKAIIVINWTNEEKIATLAQVVVDFIQYNEPTSSSWELSHDQNHMGLSEQLENLLFNRILHHPSYRTYGDY